MTDTTLTIPTPICETHVLDAPYGCACGNILLVDGTSEICQMCLTPDDIAIICPDCGREVTVEEGHG